MTFKARDGEAIFDSDINAVAFPSVISGFDRFADALTIDVAAGKVLIDNAVQNVNRSVLTIDAGEVNPRKDLVYVDTNGALQVLKGTAEAVNPRGKDKFETFRPVIPETPDGAVPLWVIYVAANATSINDNDTKDYRVVSQRTFRGEFDSTLQYDKGDVVGVGADIYVSKTGANSETYTNSGAWVKIGDAHVNDVVEAARTSIANLSETQKTAWRNRVGSASADEVNQLVNDLATGSISFTQGISNAATVPTGTVPVFRAGGTIIWSIGSSTGSFKTDDFNALTPVSRGTQLTGGNSIPLTLNDDTFRFARGNLDTLLVASDDIGSFTLNYDEKNIHQRFTDLLDTPSGLTANQYVKGNSSGNALEFGQLPTILTQSQISTLINAEKTFRGDYSASTSYDKGDIVQSGSKFYVSITDGNSNNALTGYYGMG